MTNNEHQTNPPFIYDLPYKNTEWALFFTFYEDNTQNQLQKFILKTENERKLWSQNVENPYESIKTCQHIFKRTYYNTETKRYTTPPLLLQSKVFNPEEVKQKRKIGPQILSAYLKRQEKELQEMKDYYEQTKVDIATKLKVHRKEHANEIIECPHCKAKVTRTGISKHKKSIKCQSTLSSNG